MQVFFKIAYFEQWIEECELEDSTMSLVHLECSTKGNCSQTDAIIYP